MSEHDDTEQIKYASRVALGMGISAAHEDWPALYLQIVHLSHNPEVMQRVLFNLANTTGAFLQSTADEQEKSLDTLASEHSTLIDSIVFPGQAPPADPEKP